MLVPWLPTSASEEIDRIEFVFWFMTVICIGVFAVVAAAILYSVLKFRAAPDDDSDGPPIHGHTGLEIVWTAVPAVLVTAISIVSAIVLAQNDDAGPNPLRIDVTAQQFAWKFEYPGDEQARLRASSCCRSTGRSKLTLHALDVIHSFWVPEFGQKQDAVPGIETTLVITPTRIGNYPVICTELCGLGHATMRAPVRVVDQARVREVPGRQGRRRTGRRDLGRGALHVRGLRRLSRLHARRHRRAGRAEPGQRRSRRKAAATTSSASRSWIRTPSSCPGTSLT